MLKATGAMSGLRMILFVMLLNNLIIAILVATQGWEEGLEPMPYWAYIEF
mgnify:CR=1 FL=1